MILDAFATWLPRAGACSNVDARRNGGSGRKQPQEAQQANLVKAMSGSRNLRSELIRIVFGEYCILFLFENTATTDGGCLQCSTSETLTSSP